VALLQILESLTSSLATPQERDRAYHQLAQLLRRWAHTMDRRDALHLLYRAALAAASAAATLDSDGYERIASVLSGQSRVDPPTLEHIEAILWSCRRQDRALGPHAALDTVLAQRQLARSLLSQCPTELRPRLLSVQSEASRLAGWLSFDLNQFDDAGYYYEDALDAAHAALPAAGDDPAGSVLFYDEAIHIGIRAGCHLELHDPQRAVDYAQQTLGNLDPSAARNKVFVTVDLGTAYLQGEEIDEAARLLGDAGEIAAGNSSARLAERLQQARARLQPWQDTTAVRELDDRLTAYGLA